MPMTEEQKRAYRKAYQERKREDERIRALIPSPSTLPSAPISNLVPAEMATPIIPKSTLVPAEMPRGDAFAREMTLADQAEQNRMNARTRKLSSLDNAFGAEEQSLDLPFQKQETVDPFMNPLKKLSVDDLPTAEEYNEPKKNNVSMDKVDRWLDPNYQLSKEEKKEAQETAESFFSRYGLEHAPMKDIYKYAAEHPEFNEEYEKMKKLTLKATTLGNFGSGFKSAFTDVASGLADMAIGKTKDNADKYAGLVSSMTGVPEEEVRNTIGNAYGQIAEKKQDIFNPIETEKENAKTQNSLAYGAGNLGGKALQYIATEPLFAGAAASAGLGKGGAFVANQVGQNAQDLALDTLPFYYEMQRQGLSDDEIGKELAKNIGINAGMNLGMGVLGEIPGLIKNAKNAKQLPQLDDAAKMQEYYNSQANPTIERQLLDELNASDRRIAEEAAAQQTQIPTELVEQARAEQAMQRRIAEEAAAKESRLTPDMLEQPKVEVEAPKAEAVEAEKQLAEESPKAETPKALDRLLDPDDMRVISRQGAEFEKRLKGTKNTPEFEKAYNDFWEYIVNSGQAGKNTLDRAAVEEALRRTAPDGVDVDSFLKAVDEQLDSDGLKFDTDAEHTMKALSEKEKNAIANRTFRDMTDDEISRIKDGFSANKRYVREMEARAMGDADLTKAVEEVKAAHNAYYDAAIKGDRNLIERYSKDFNNAVSRASRKFDKAGIKDFAQSKKQTWEFGDPARRVLETANPDEAYIDNLVKDWNEWDEVDPLHQYARPANKEKTVALAAKNGDSTYMGSKKFSEIMGDKDLQNADTTIKRFGDEPAEMPPEKDMAISKGRTNSLERAGIDTEEELQNVIPKEDFAYLKQHEKDTVSQARTMLSTEQGDAAAIERYTKNLDDKEARSMGAVDIDAMMMLRQELNEAARAATDPVEKAALYEQSRQIALNMTKATRESGRAMQALVKWTRTVDGAMTAAEGYAENMVENALKNYPNLGKDIESASKEINNFLDNMDAEAMTREDIEKMIESAVKKRDHLKKRVTKKDIQTLTDAVLSDKQWVDIQNHLEYLATGYNKISPETMDEVQAIFEEAYQLPYNSKQRMKLEEQAFNKLGAEIAPNGGSFGEKFDAWRYLAMLANPSTHIKNMVGNLAFGKGVVSIKNSLAAIIEAGAERVAKLAGKDFKRTKSILTPADNELVKLARQDGLDNAFRELSGNKYFDAGSAIDEATPAFKNKGLGKGINKAAEINSKALSGEDELAGLGKYKTSLAGFLKANGADASIFSATDDASKELLEQAREYAINQAQEATFHQNSRVANALSQFTKNLRNNDSKAAKALGLTIDTIIPFKKTPINILRSTIQYSPVEMFKVLTDIPKVKKGIMSGAEMIDDIAKTATGTGMLGIGALLAHNGIITSGFTDSDEKTNFDRTTGRQGIAVHINIPGMQPFTVSLSELSPAAMPLIFGAAIYESKQKKDADDGALDVIINGLSASVNAITDMTMLSGISDLLSNIRYAESDVDVFKKIGSHVVGNLAGQMIPSVGGRIEKVIDPDKRSTYATNSGTLGEIERVGRQAANKIPFLNPIADKMAESNNDLISGIGGAIRNQNSIDAWGREMEQPGINAGGRAVLNLLSPVNIQADRSDELDRALYAIEERSGLPAYPKTTQSEGNIDGTRLTGDQFTEYAKYKGQLSRELAEQLILSGDYDDTNDETKAGALNTIYGFAKAMAQDNAVGKEMSSTNAKLKEIYETDGAKGVADYIVRGNETKEIAQNAGIKNNDAVKKAYDEGGATLAEQTANTIATLQDADLKPSAYYAYDHAKSVLPGLDDQTFINTYKAINTDWTKGNTSISAKEMEAYLNRIKATYEQGRQIASAYYTGGDGKWNLVDGEWKYKRASK